MDIAQIKSFYVTAKTGNITRASEQLFLTRSTISKHIKSLESELGGKRLMERHHFGVELTDEGALFFDYAQMVCESTESIKSALDSCASNSSGTLKVIASTTVGGAWFGSHMGEFTDTHPDVVLEMIYEERKSLEFSRANSGVYAGFTNYPPNEKKYYIVNNMAKYHLYPFASKEYLEIYGNPKTAHDLDAHKLISYRLNSDFSYIEGRKINCLQYMEARDGRKREPSVLTDDAIAATTMAKSGAGIVLLPRYIAKKGGLEEVLQGGYSPTMGGEYSVFFIYPQYLRANVRIKTLKDFISEKIHQDRDLFL